MTRDLIAIGRISVDLYAQESHATFAEPQTFVKSIGGSPTNVAIAAARLGCDSAMVTKVGQDALGSYARARLTGFGVDTSFVGTDPNGQTPLVLASLAPPEEPEIVFYRGASAPDTTMVAADVPSEVLSDCRVMWVSACALAAGATASACVTWLEQRGRASHTIVDLDFRRSLWADLQTARASAQQVISMSSIVVGNLAECEMALGTDDPDSAADTLLDKGVCLAIVKMGGAGVLLATDSERTRVAPLAIKVRCGIGSGDAFGGALVYGLIHGWTLGRIAEFANAAGAYVASEFMCADAMPDLATLSAFIDDHDVAMSMGDEHGR